MNIQPTGSIISLLTNLNYFQERIRFTSGIPYDAAYLYVALLKDKKFIAKPVYRMNSTKVFLTIPPNGKKNVYVSIYDGAGKVVHEERFKNASESIKVLNFENSEKGMYNIRVWNSNGIYFETYEVK